MENFEWQNIWFERKKNHNVNIEEEIKGVKWKTDEVLSFIGWINKWVESFLKRTLEVLSSQKKVWVMIWRLNPPHIWHIKVIRKAIEENWQIILFLWSANVVNKKNPFTYEERKSFLEEIFRDEIESWRLVIGYLDDVSDNQTWTRNLNEKVKKILPWVSEINFYWWDFKEDMAINCIRDNQWLVKVKKVKYTQIHRNTIKTENGDDVSATNLRRELNWWNYEAAKSFMNPEIAELIINAWKKKINS